MQQISLTEIGVLQHFSDYTLPELQMMSSDKLSQCLKDELRNHSYGLQSLDIDPDSLVVDLAVVVFLLKAANYTVTDLRAMTLEDEKNTLITWIYNQNNNPTSLKYIPIWRLQALSSRHLLTMALLSYTKIDFTLEGLLPLFGKTYDPTNIPTAWADVVSLLRHFYSDDQSDSNLNFNNLSHAVLLGKLGILVFYIRCNGIDITHNIKRDTSYNIREWVVKETYYRTGIAYQFLSGEIKQASNDWIIKRYFPINDQELVTISLGWYVVDKPFAEYNEVTWVLAHDSFTGDKEYIGGDASRDQNCNIDQQLASGIRAVRISAEYYPEEDEVILVHGHFGDDTPATNFGTLNNYLERIKNFLDINKHEIITIIDESKWDERIASIYETQLGARIFNYNKECTIDDLSKGVWPTLMQMRNWEYQVVVFNDNDFDSAVPWRFHSYDGISKDFFISMDRDDYGLDADYNCRPPFLDVQNIDADGNLNHERWNPGSHLYLLNHYIYHDVAGHNSSSRYRSGRWGNGEYLIEYAMLAWQKTGRKPNFIQVDFYDLPFILTNFVFELATALNRVDAYGPFEVPDLINAKKPIFITDTIGETDGLRLGQVYTIQCVAQDKQNKSYNIARADDADGAAVYIAPSDPSNVRQHWKIVYNTPQTGFSIVTPDGKYALYDHNWDLPNRNINSKSNSLVLKDRSCDPRGKGFAMSLFDEEYIYLYKSNMAVPAYDHISKKVFYTQELSLWQVLDTDDVIDNQKTNIGRWEKSSNIERNKNQKWIFTPIPSADTSPTWSKVSGTIQSITPAQQLPPVGENLDPGNHFWFENIKPILEQVKAFALANPTITYFFYTPGVNKIFLYSSISPTFDGGSPSYPSGYMPNPSPLITYYVLNDCDWSEID